MAWLKNRGHGVAVLYTEILRRPFFDTISWLKKCESRCKLRIRYTNRTGSCPEFFSLSWAQEFLDNICSFEHLFYRKKSRWVPLTVACEEAHCEKSRASGTQKEMWEWGTASDSRTRNGVELARSLNIQVRILLNVETVDMHHLVTIGKIWW